ncbi:exodeoxyribonuclease I [Gynuella sunshinyii]|uniref:Exodeoxyribonuclease I n=1 Tax=Gynuella sunshinyii YC6258 TaxID=1445510 RepID=A0A0C5VQU1_9GAMM|nr:exodeoxyribonuclease I [Gynuella sunshinyii]AJQ96626.1 exonuclease I [Gynuella sunshinyii YC6258]
MSATLLWYDYETWGSDPRRDRAAQFAAVRTDMELNQIGEPIDLLCKPALDTVIDPGACQITHISPKTALARGVSELEFANLIHAQMSQPQTCTLGYNSIRFDDELTRFLFYRNLLDPYEREWKHGNSRWDLLDVARLTYALRPEGIHWPTGLDGKTSFRLELLTQANGIQHESAHDAVSDVKATIAFARLIRSVQPRLFDFAFSLRQKQTVQEQFDFIQRKPVLHISGMFPVEQGCMAVVAPIGVHPLNRNEIICFNLDQDPELLLQLSAEEISQRLFTATADLPEGVERIGLKSIHANKSPMVVPVKMLDQDVARRFGFDLERLRQHAAKLQQMPHIDQKIAEIYSREPMPEVDPDEALYAGFINDADKSLMSTFRSLSPEQMAEFSGHFSDSRLNALAFRLRARNYPNTLQGEEKQRWLERCREVFTQQTSGCPRTGEQALDQLQQYRLESPEDEVLWNDIEQHLLLQRQALLGS